MKNSEDCMLNATLDIPLCWTGKKPTKSSSKQIQCTNEAHLDDEECPHNICQCDKKFIEGLLHNYKECISGVSFKSTVLSAAFWHGVNQYRLIIQGLINFSARYIEVLSGAIATQKRLRQILLLRWNSSFDKRFLLRELPMAQERDTNSWFLAKKFELHLW